MAFRNLSIGVTMLAAVWMGCMGPPGQEPDVGMTVSSFEPALLTVQIGEEVLWRNTSTLAHTVTSDNESGPLDSGLLDPGQEHRYTFTEPGNYTYHCEPHSRREGDGSYTGMIGTVIVEP